MASSEKTRARWKRYRERHPAMLRTQKKLQYASLIAGARLAYGNQCACCGEREPSFLTTDHIKEDGAAQRKELGFSSGNALLWWLKRNGYPPGFQTLCRNCNWAKHVLGQCPHQQR